MEGEIWDEERWEAFLRENDRHLERYMALLFRFMSENPPAGEAGSADRKAWEEDLRSYLMSNGVDEDHPIAPTPGDELDEMSREDEDILLEAFDTDDVLSSLDRLPVYQLAHSYSVDVLKWSNRLPGHLKDSTLVQFCSCVTQVPGNLAKGHGIGYERDMIGGNIACAKRALAAANAALTLLREMRSATYLDDTVYLRYYEELFHVRNAVGIYVQELRDRFNLGVE